MGLLHFLLRLLSRKQYGTPSATSQGEWVKSKAEQRIADYFTRNGIRYEYERGAQTNALIFKRTFAKPDFYLPDYNVYVEYWGLVGASRNYERTMKWKMAQYYRNRIKFISLYPSNMNNLDWIFRTKFRQATGLELPLRSSTIAPAKYCSNCGIPVALGSRFCNRCGKSY